MKDIGFSERNGDLIFALDFKNSFPDFKGPVFYPRSIQIEFQNAYVKPSKRVFPSIGNEITKVFAAQYDPKTVRVRFILTEEGIDLRNKFHITWSGQTLQIKIDRAGVDALDRFMSEIATQDQGSLEGKEIALSAEPMIAQKGSFRKNNLKLILA